MIPITGGDGVVLTAQGQREQDGKRTVHGMTPGKLRSGAFYLAVDERNARRNANCGAALEQGLRQGG